MRQLDATCPFESHVRPKRSYVFLTAEQIIIAIGMTQSEFLCPNKLGLMTRNIEFMLIFL